ncbi:MAG: hypothetical protein A2991_03260 [Candidatus Terrybacteria bacterium RIFCSPLOWO2_01_FULL_58_14]|uniref:Putative gluconeogenesis factor n=2 Tax=Candidatus Terryibacteriota TaxID=1817920 RepID=A0A1G2PXA7_9BACT|nr:MAG: hypothetical protein A2682_02430 [Candidatus Terrybacteria bacterium RIFCSPHIGHO2_01_FULL_58_15]OHA52409.1 MAG: hypothetical protein A2991_03260 [Candidatus Terrybacteria bacterium RIFCSPLOWO2_01_FULL_58_14]
MKARNAPKRKKRIVVIGGGTGIFNLLTGLKRTGHRITAIVTMADDGGSTGMLREEFGILPPGDVRRALVALSYAERSLADLFAYRFEEGEGLAGHPVGNLLLTALERMTGSFERAVEEAGRILRIEGEVVPVTLDDVRLTAWMKGGGVVRGEHAIDVPLQRRITRIIRIALTPKARANPRALEAISRADLILLGPGDLYTSILPNLAVHGIAKAIRRSSAKKVFVVNLMTKRGETDHFSARDFVDALERMLGRGVLSAILINTSRAPRGLAQWYREKGKVESVRWSKPMFRGVSYAVVTAPLLRREGKFIRHDPEKLARAVLRILIRPRRRKRPVTQ